VHGDYVKEVSVNGSISFTADHYYSTRELAVLLHANESTIKRWSDKGALKCFRTPGGHRRFTPQSVFEFIKKYHYEFHPELPSYSKEPGQ